MRAVYRLVRTNRLPLAARLSTSSCSTRRRPGKAFERAQLEELVEQERRRLAAAARGRGRRSASVASKAPRAPARRASLTGNGDGGRRPRAETARASSPCARRRCTAPTVRPRRSRSCCSSVVRPLPHPPSEHRNARRRRVERGNDAACQSASEASTCACLNRGGVVDGER